jgi:hypothetical protein
VSYTFTGAGDNDHPSFEAKQFKVVFHPCKIPLSWIDFF